MNAKTLLCSLVIASLGMSSVSFAQPGHGDDHDRGHGHGNDARHDNRNDHDDRNDHGERNNAREDHFYNARSAEFHRGGRLPSELRSRQYVVSDWHGHHLSAPPRGYQWVQVGPDYVLAAVATGIIANLIISR